MFLFRTDRRPDDEGFYTTDVAADEIEAGTIRVTKVAREVVIVARSGSQLYAFSNICPHAAADLSRGRFRQRQIKCPDHGYTFDVATGRATWPEGEGCRLRRFEIKVEEGMVKIRLEDRA